jgi:hypothetical protein
MWQHVPPASTDYTITTSSDSLQQQHKVHTHRGVAISSAAHVVCEHIYVSQKVVEDATHAVNQPAAALWWHPHGICHATYPLHHALVQKLDWR